MLWLSDMYNRCVHFLERNGWSANVEPGPSEYLSLEKDECIAVDINKKEIVLLDDTGDFLHLPVNYYALVGALFEYRQIPANYSPTPYSR